MPRSARAKRPSRRAHHPTQSIIFGGNDSDSESIGSFRSYGSGRRSMATIHSDESFHSQRSNNPPKQPGETVPEPEQKPKLRLFTQVMPFVFAILLWCGLCFPHHVVHLGKEARNLIQSQAQAKPIEYEFKVTKPSIRKTSKPKVNAVVQAASEGTSSTSSTSGAFFSSVFPKMGEEESKQEEHTEGEAEEESEEHRHLREKIEELEERLRQRMASSEDSDNKPSPVNNSNDALGRLLAAAAAEQDLATSTATAVRAEQRYESQVTPESSNPIFQGEQETLSKVASGPLKTRQQMMARDQEMGQHVQQQAFAASKQQLGSYIPNEAVNDQIPASSHVMMNMVPAQREPASQQLNQQTLSSSHGGLAEAFPQTPSVTFQQATPRFNPDKVGEFDGDSRGYDPAQQQIRNVGNSVGLYGTDAFDNIASQLLEPRRSAQQYRGQLGDQSVSSLGTGTAQLENQQFQYTDQQYHHHQSNHDELQHPFQQAGDDLHQQEVGKRRRLTADDPSTNLRHRKLVESNFPQQVDIARIENAPSHVRICQAVVHNFEVVVNEGIVCAEPTHFTFATAEILLSGYLATVARFHGFQVEYKHECGRFQTNTFQNMIPSPLAAPTNFQNGLDRRDLIGFCSLVFHRYVVKRTSNPLEILLWDTQNAGDPTRPSDPNHPPLVQAGWRGLHFNSKGDVFGSSGQKELLERIAQERAAGGQVSMLERLIPFIQENFRAGLVQARSVGSHLGENIQVQAGETHLVERFAAGKGTLFLPCKDPEGRDAVVVPLYAYVTHIPNSIDTLDVVVSKQCFDTSPGLREYASLLIANLRQFSPQRAVNLVVSSPSSLGTVVRLVEHEFVICGPGTGMVCLFPALSRTSGRFTVLDMGFDLVEGYSTASFVSMLSPELIHHIQPHAISFPTPFISQLDFDPAKILSFAVTPPRAEEGECRSLRGRVGTWVQDMDYAATAQYKRPLNESYSGVTDVYFRQQVEEGKTNLKYRPPTTYRWDELLYKNCPVIPISSAGVCGVLKSLDVRRIFILGDSLSAQTSESMWMLLTEGTQPFPQGFKEHLFKTSISCVDFEYTLQFVRNDTLAESEPIKGYVEKSKPWIESYASDPSRTILLVNTGPHIKSVDAFRNSIDGFFRTMDDMNRPDDIILMRTSVPGHWNCSRVGIKPFNSFAEYQQDRLANGNEMLEQVFGWDLFELYNRYMAKAIDDFNLGSPRKKRPLAELVDVFPMTVQRPDGHCSDEFRPELIGTNDCLHYDLPGPIDWWSHMVYSHLEDIAAIERSRAGKL